MDSLRDGASQLVNTNKLIRFYEGATGLKTGSTDTALYCLSGTAERDGMELIAVILKAPTSAQRFEDATNAAELRLFHLHAGECGARSRPAAGGGALGTQATVQPVLEETPHLLLEKAKAGNLQQLGHPGGVCGGAGGAGQSLGTLTITSGEEIGGGAAHPGRRGDPTGHLRTDAGADAADGLPSAADGGGVRRCTPLTSPAELRPLSHCVPFPGGIIRQQTRAALRKRGRSMMLDVKSVPMYSFSAPAL